MPSETIKRRNVQDGDGKFRIEKNGLRCENGNIVNLVQGIYN